MSCDTFVALNAATTKGCIIFGKNSDRPKGEVQEVVHFPAADHPAGSKVQCTYLEIDQAPHTHAVVLSKPAWMWGAEMGANEHDVVIGNEAVWTKECSEADEEEKLLGMDMIRLALERADTAKAALDVISGLLLTQGQGGPCFDDPNSNHKTYHNSFIIADRNEAWVLETAGQHWAAEKVSGKVRNISNQLSVGTQIDAMSDGLQDHAKTKGYWDGSSDFDFAKAFSAPCHRFSLFKLHNYHRAVTEKVLAKHCSPNMAEASLAVKLPDNETPSSRFQGGKELMEAEAQGGIFSIKSMMKVLRNKEKGICRVGTSGSVTMASMVSMIAKPGSQSPSCHWFTATPNPSCSVFKPFIFCEGVKIGSTTISPTFDDDPAKIKPRFQKQVDRRHRLYKAHESINPLPGDQVHDALLGLLLDMEEECVEEVDGFLSEFSPSKAQELQELFPDIVESEMKFHNK